MSDCECVGILGELKEFKREQIVQNERIYQAVKELHDFKSKTLAQSKLIAIIISSAISVASILVSVFIAYQSHFRSG